MNSTLYGLKSYYGATKFLWTKHICLAIKSSYVGLDSSKRINIKSNLERSAAGRLIFWCGVNFLL